MGRPIRLTVGPLAAADADGVGVTQTAAAAQYLVINGALAAGTFDADSICASQTPGGAGALTINGALATTAGVAGAGGSAGAVSSLVRFSVPTRVYITCAGNNSGRTFTVTGTLQGVGTFGPGVVVSETVTGANANTVATTALFSTVTSVAISGASTGAVTVGHSGTATMDTGRRVILTSSADDTGITFTVSGTDWVGNLISEVVTGVNNAAASSVLDYYTVTSVLTSGATTGTVQVGTNGVAGSPWARFDDYAGNAQFGLQVTAAGTVNYTVQYTYDDPNVITNQLPTPTYQLARSAVTWVDSGDTAVVAATATKQSTGTVIPEFARVVLNSGTGSVTMTIRQPYTG